MFLLALPATKLKPQYHRHFPTVMPCCLDTCYRRFEGAGIPAQQLPSSRLVAGLVGMLQLTTLAAFLLGMAHQLPDKMPEICLLVACLLATPYLHYR